MALELPDWLTDVFNLIGLPWPGIDEDQLRAWATGVRSFSDSITGNSSQTNRTMQELAESSQSSVLSGVAQQYESHHQLLTELHGPMGDFAQALDYAADAVVAQKWAVIGAATTLAGEFTATQIGAFFTFGADEAALPEEVISTQQIVKFALKELEAVVIGRLINRGAAELSDHVNSAIFTLANDAWGVKMEADGLKVAYEKISGAARTMLGQADDAEESGDSADAENTGRDLTDGSGGGGWSEVINALKQGLIDIAQDLFKSLPQAIAMVMRSIADVLEKLAVRIKGADEDNVLSVAGSSARVGAPGVGETPGSANEQMPSKADSKPDAPERSKWPDPKDKRPADYVRSEDSPPSVDGPHEHPENWIKDLNSPKGKPGRLNNCAECARSVDSTWHGQPTKPAAMTNPRSGGESPISLMGDWAGRQPTTSSMSDVQQKLKALGPGSSAVVGCDWKTGGGHWFNAVNDGGTIKAVDGQSGIVEEWPPSKSGLHYDESMMKQSDAIFFDSSGKAVEK